MVPEPPGPSPLRALLQSSLASAAQAAEIDEIWATGWTAAHEAWPEVELDARGFADFVARKVDPGADVIAALDRLHFDGLYLACACVQGQVAALRAFDARFQSELASAARGGGATAPDEIVQRLRVKLLVGDNARLADYAGTTPLKNWLKLAARRLAIDLARSEKSRSAREQKSGSAGGGGNAGLADRLIDNDPELEMLKQRYRVAFRQAFDRAMGDLSPRTRTMLRLSVMHGLSIDEIAPMHGVHRATVARWLGKARGEVLLRTREYLAELLDTDDAEVDSIMNMIASRLEVSMSRHLRTRVGETSYGRDSLDDDDGDA